MHKGYRHKHKKTHRNRSRSNKNIVKATLKKSYNVVNSTSKRYMPKVKMGLESIGSSVINKSKKTVPYLQRMTRKAFEMFTKNKK